MTIPRDEYERLQKQRADISADPQNQCGMRQMTVEERLADIFTFHDDYSKVPNYTAIRSAAKHLAEVIMQNSPVSADQTTALRCVREAVLWANAAVALDGRSLG